MKINNNKGVQALNENWNVKTSNYDHVFTFNCHSFVFPLIFFIRSLPDVQTYNTVSYMKSDNAVHLIKIITSIFWNFRKSKRSWYIYLAFLFPQDYSRVLNQVFRLFSCKRLFQPLQWWISLSTILLFPNNFLLAVISF